MRKLLWSFYFFFFAGISSAFAASEMLKNVYSSISADTSQMMLADDSDVQKNLKGNRAYGTTISIGKQFDLDSKMYVNAEIFYSYAENKVKYLETISGSVIDNQFKIKSSQGVLSRFGYKFCDKLSAYLGVGFGFSQYSSANPVVSGSGTSHGAMSRNLKTGIFAIGANYNINKTIQVFTETKYFQTEKFGAFSTSGNTKIRLATAMASIGVRAFIN